MTKGYGCRHEGLATIYEFLDDGLIESKRIRNHNRVLRRLSSESDCMRDAISLEEYRARQRRDDKQNLTLVDALLSIPAAIYFGIRNGIKTVRRTSRSDLLWYVRRT